MRTGSSFSFSAMTAIARASTSLPPPGAVCTTISIGRAGWNAAALAAASAVAHTIIRRIIDRSFRLGIDSGFLLERAQSQGVHPAKERQREQRHRDDEQR